MMGRRFGIRVRASLALLGALACAAPAWAAEATPPLHLRIVGGLGSLNQFTRHERPFWETDLARLSQGRYTAEIVPFDRAGIRSQEVLTLVQLGAVPFATLPVSGGITKDPELTAPDLAGLNPDMASMRRSVAAFHIGRQIIATEPYRSLIFSEVRPGAQVVAEEDIKAFIRQVAGTVYHPCGTCRMGQDDSAVVDPELRVRGLEGLRVVDASVMPAIPSPNIHPATIMVAERGSDIIGKSLVS